MLANLGLSSEVEDDSSGLSLLQKNCTGYSFLWSPWRLRTARSPFQRTGKARKGLERIAEDAPQLPHGPRRFCRDQVPASVTATESLHGGRARPCPATRSCFPGTSSLTAPVRTRESPGSRSPAPGVATAPSTGRASGARSTDPPGH